jgi:thioredoxin-related protein
MVILVLAKFLHMQKFILIIVFILFSQVLCADGYERLLYLKDFQKLGQRACQEHKAMVVMISRESCPYCIKLKKQIFIPEVKHGELNDKWLLRELRIDGGMTHIDFNGNKVNSVDYARSIKATLTPTVLFLDKNGTEVGERIIGIGGALEFYDFYLKKSINQALENQQCD